MPSARRPKRSHEATSFGSGCRLAVATTRYSARSIKIYSGRLAADIVIIVAIRGWWRVLGRWRRRRRRSLAPDEESGRLWSTIRPGAVVRTQSRHVTLSSVETLGVGSAKVPHLPILETVIAAPDADAVIDAVGAEAATLNAFARRLAASGLHAMAATARRAIGARRWNADLRSLLEWVYGATFKTSGRATMSFAPWYADPSVSTPQAVWEGGSTCSAVRLPPDIVEQAALANALVYERLIGGLNACEVDLGDGASCQEVCDAVAAARRGTAPAPLFARPQDLKSLLKVDYKLGPDHDLLLIDVSAGLVGLVFDDELLDGLDGACGAPPTRCASRLLDAIWQRFELERGSVPRSAAVLVLDQEMFEQWRDSDLLGLRSRLGLRLPIGPGTPPAEAVPVLTLDAIEAWADAASGTPETLGAPWRGVPDLMVAFSCRVGELVRPTTYAWLRGLGVTIVDERRHAFAAAKELCTASVLGDPLSARVRLPETLVLELSDVVGVPASPGHAERLVAAGWERASSLGWPALAFKIGKVRRAYAAGDYPTAYVYPVTDVGRDVAGRSLGRTWKQMTEAGVGPTKVVLSRVETRGGYPCPEGRHDIEVRTYAFPMSHTGGDGHLIVAQSPDGDGLPSFPARKRV